MYIFCVNTNIIDWKDGKGAMVSTCQLQFSMSAVKYK